MKIYKQKKNKEELRKIQELRRSNAATSVTSKKHYIRHIEKERHKDEYTETE